MTARLVLPPGAPEEEWLAARRRGVTASEIAAVLGISPFDSAYNLYWKKLGAIPEDFDNDRLELGRVLEPYVASRFAKTHPDIDLARGGLFQSVERPWQMATPDYLLDVPGEDGKRADSVLEVKTSGTYEGWGDDGTDEMPAYIAAQVLWQLDVLGCRVGYVSCLFLATQQIRTYEIAYDAEDVALMRKRGLEFWEQVQTGEPPDLDAHSATASALKTLHPDVDEDEEITLPADVAERYRAAKAALKVAQEAVDLAENRLRDAMGDAKYALDPAGQKVATRSIYDRKGYTVKPTRIDALKPAPIKKETAA